ncbi:hypothetical protein, partial [Burkholderia pseudomallei]
AASTTRSRRTRNPDPRKTKPHAHKNVGFVSSLNPAFKPVFFAFGPARSARAGDAATDGGARQARRRAPARAPRYRAISPAARRIARRIAPLTRS